MDADMKEPLDPTRLDRLEEQTYLSRFDDGLLDLLIGLGILGFAVGVIVGEAMITILSPAFAPILWKSLQEKVTIPRLGYVRFSEERRTRERQGVLGIRLVLLAAVLLGAGAWFAFDRGGYTFPVSSRELGLAPVALIMAALMVVGAMAFGLGRAWYYAVLCLAAAAAVPLGLPAEYGLVATGTIMALAGLGMLVRFLRRYPAHPAGAQ
jgi:hypothetical protein